MSTSPSGTPARVTRPGTMMMMIPPPPREEHHHPQLDHRPARREHRSLFPYGGCWEITPERAVRWYGHRFSGLRGDTRFMRRLGPLDRHEMALLLADLDCYEDLLRRHRRGDGPPPPPLHEYLLPGREDWGRLGRLLRRAFAAGPPPAAAAAALADSGPGVQARTILALADRGFTPAAIAALTVGDVDLEAARIGKEMVDAALLALAEASIDELPAAEAGAPLFLDRHGAPMTAANVRRVIRLHGW